MTLEVLELEGLSPASLRSLTPTPRPPPPAENGIQEQASSVATLDPEQVLKNKMKGATPACAVDVTLASSSTICRHNISSFRSHLIRIRGMTATAMGADSHPD